MNAHNNKKSRKLRCTAGLLAWPALSLVISMVMPVASLAAGSSSIEASNTGADARWFQVELILFSQQTDLALDAEQWPNIEGLKLPETVLELHLPQAEVAAEDQFEIDDNTTTTEPATTTTAPAAETAPGTSPDATQEASDMPTAYQILPKDQLQLTDMAEKIQHSSKRNLLLHIGWQQPTYDRNNAKPVFLIDGMADPLPVNETNMPTDGRRPVATEEDLEIGPIDPRFVGTVTLSVERYLHIATDLTYRRPVMQHRPIPVPDLDLWYDRPYPTLKEPQGPAFQQMSWPAIRGFQLKESRRMRSTEIHYLDHPFMGMIVVITPVKLPEPAEAIQQTSPQNMLSTPAKMRTAP
jgi:hypothetical protein